MYTLEVWQLLDQPKRLTNYYLLRGYPSAEAIIQLLEEAKVAQEFSLSDLQKFFDKGSLMTNEGSIEVVIKAINLREPNTGKEKDYNFRGFDETGLPNG